MISYLLVLSLCRNVNYTINGNHRQHVLVRAEVVPVALELSSEDITLKSSPGIPADGGESEPVVKKPKILN